MTQTNNEREALKKALLELECYKGEILLDGNRPNDLRDLNETILIVKSAIAQSEQQEAVAEVRLDENNMKYIHWYKPWVHVLSSNSKLYTSPPKQAIPEGWISVKDRLPDNDYEVYFVLLNDLSCGTTFSYDDAKSSIDDKTVDICFIREGNKWMCAQGTYDLEKIKYWMRIPRAAPTNTEVGE